MNALDPRHTGPDPGQTAPRLYPLKEALRLAGITAPTYYRWLKAGKIDDRRIRGKRGATLLSAEAITKLRNEATRVHVV